MDVSFQLYSSREVPSQLEFLSTLSSLGYTQVEGYGGVYDQPEKLRSALDQANLKMVSGHFALTDLEADIDAQLELAQSLGIKHIFVPFLAPQDRPTNTIGYAAVAKRLHALGSVVNAEGFSFGWHNHEFELQALSDGSMPLDIILNEAPNRHGT